MDLLRPACRFCCHDCFVQILQFWRNILAKHLIVRVPAFGILMVTQWMHRIVCDRNTLKRAITSK